MRVYVVQTENGNLREVFVNEQDAENWVADEEARLVGPNRTKHFIRPRTLRTAHHR